jgi:hypothetical protein
VLFLGVLRPLEPVLRKNKRKEQIVHISSFTRIPDHFVNAAQDGVSRRLRRTTAGGKFSRPKSARF